MLTGTRTAGCADEDCTGDAVIGRWCPGHAIAKYRREAVRADAPTSYKRGSTARECAAGFGCRYPAVGSSTMCGRHERQMERRGRVTPIAQRRRRYAALERDAQGRKECACCLTWRPVSEYGASPVQDDGLQTACKPCVRLGTYNVIPERYASMFDAQGGVCAVCERPDATGRDLSVDHDHACCRGSRSCGQCVRGLLCTRCNLGLGRLQDSPELVSRASAYLRHWASQPPREVGDMPKPRGRRWDAFRLTDEDYAGMLEAQGGGCAICSREPGARALAVDHDHGCCPTRPTCGTCVRGLLCMNCNVGLGHFDEDPELLDRAAKHLVGALIVCR